MTNKEIKKWLKRCGSTDSLCDGCPFRNVRKYTQETLTVILNARYQQRAIPRRAICPGCYNRPHIFITHKP